MAAACAATPTSMAAVLGGDPEVVVARIEELGLTAANRNAAGQIVAAGAVDALAELAAQPPAGARVRPLEVAGAFHTSYMASAQQALAEAAESLTVRDPAGVLLSNSDGRAVEEGPAFLARLVSQITAPVRWDLCQQTMRDIRVTAAIELPPAGTLVGLAKREIPGITLLGLKSPADLDAAGRLLSAASAAAQGGHTPDLLIAVSPAKGTLAAAEGLHEGGLVRAGQVIGELRANSAAHPIAAPIDGMLAEWVRHDGDIVSAGAPIARFTASKEG
jgi:[acyl-carrier-protein] S-malonyltransferase